MSYEKITFGLDVLKLIEKNNDIYSWHYSFALECYWYIIKAQTKYFMYVDLSVCRTLNIRQVFSLPVEFSLLAFYLNILHGWNIPCYEIVLQ